MIWLDAMQAQVAAAEAEGGMGFKAAPIAGPAIVAASAEAGAHAIK